MTQATEKTSQENALTYIYKSAKDIDINLLAIALLLIVLAFAYVASTFSNKGKKIGRARLATKSEVRKSRDAAIEAINKPREVSLWIGMPDQFSIHPETGCIALIPNRHTVMLRKANEHFMFYGTTGAGKTRYGLNRLAFSAIMKNLPIIAIDLKGDEERPIIDEKGNEIQRIAPTSELAGYGLENGYEIFSIAPFFDDSHCLNVVQLLKSAEDLGTANLISNAIVENGLAEGEKPDTWSMAGGQLLAAGLLMARSQEKGDDLAMAQKLLARLAQDPESIRSAQIGQYQKAAYDEFLASAKSPETAASVAFSALRMVSRIMIPEITAVFCRQTNIPIVLKRKQMLIFRVDPEYASVILPLVSACVEVILRRNVFSGQPFGGLALLDELPQYRLPNLAKIMAVARSKNWCFALGAQGESILEESYGKARTLATLENVQTLSIMRLASNATSKNYSEALGKEDAATKNKSSGRGGSSVTVQNTMRDLVPMEELQQQPDGRCILYTPTVSAVMDGGIKGEKRVRIPYRQQFVIPKQELAAMDRAKLNWLKYCPIARQRSRARPLTEKELLGRELLANHLLPDSPDSKKSSANVEEKLRDLFSSKSF